MMVIRFKGLSHENSRNGVANYENGNYCSIFIGRIPLTVGEQLSKNGNLKYLYYSIVEPCFQNKEPLRILSQLAFLNVYKIVLTS
jgi:hypothetical protein